MTDQFNDTNGSITEADVLVVGGGGAGLAAAYEAASAGATVILLEKNAAPGGSNPWPAFYRSECGGAADRLC